MTTLIQNDYSILSNHAIAPGHYKLVLAAPEIAVQAQPGQFIALKTSPESLLRKPFSIYAASKTSLTILYRVVGAGTLALSQCPKGQCLDTLGPLGQGWPIDHTPAPTALIAGGIGLGALGAFAAKLKKGSFDLYYGARHQDEIVDLAYWEKRARKIFLSTDDGSVGTKGFITAVFAHNLAQYQRLFCCGPSVMMQKTHALVRASQSSLSDFYILEEYMACGIGLCMGCVTKTKHGYWRTCTEGPVFKGVDLPWSI